MRKLDYAVVDVFTDTPYAGNPLAVVFGADGLATKKLQAIAREFHLSETVFILPPTSQDATYRVRIFTPTRELPFAGHPSVGAALVQLSRGMITAGRVVQECGAGLLPILVTEDGSATLSGGQPTIGPDSCDPGPLLAAVGLTAADHVGPPPRLAGCGMNFCYLSVTPDAVPRAKLLDPSALEDLSLLAWDGETRTARVRVFAPGAGVPEDPATGSAALGLGVWLVASGLLPADGTSDYTIHQGLELDRPSILRCTVTAVAGAVTATTVTGQAVDVASGLIVVPPGRD